MFSRSGSWQFQVHPWAWCRWPDGPLMWPLLTGVHQAVQRGGIDSDLSPSPRKALSSETLLPLTTSEVSHPTLCPGCVIRPRYPWAVLLLNHSAGSNTVDFVLPDKRIHSFGSPMSLFLQISSPGFSSTCSLNEGVCRHSVLEPLFLLCSGSQAWLSTGVIS